MNSINNTCLSIITINLNNAEGLRRTIQSVISQSYLNFEFIIIDGGSTDESLEIISSYSDKITYWISEPDKGIFNAMNKGILQASRDYCLFLNSGDWLVNDVLRSVFDKNYTEDVLYGNLIVEYKNGAIEIEKGCSKSHLTFNDFFNKIVCHHQATFIKRTLFFEYGFYDENYKLVSDNLFFINIIVFGNATYRYINLEIAHYDPYGLSNNADDERNLLFSRLLPSRVLDDYKVFSEQNCRIENLTNELNRYRHRFRILDLVITKMKMLLFKLQ